jgi:hypothetical protein
MPQPLKGQGAEFRPNPILDRPNAAAHLANAIAVWNLFEWELAMAYSIALGFSLPGYKGWEPTNHPMAYDIMDTIAGLGTRLDLMDAALNRVAPSLVAEFTALRKDIRRQAGKRAELAHGRWGINDLFPEDLVKEHQGGEFFRWSPKDFDNCADGFNALRQSFSDFSLKLREAAKSRPGLTPSPIPLAPEDEPQPEK